MNARGVVEKVRERIRRVEEIKAEDEEVRRVGAAPGAVDADAAAAVAIIGETSRAFDVDVDWMYRRLPGILA